MGITERHWFEDEEPELTETLEYEKEVFRLQALVKEQEEEIERLNRFISQDVIPVIRCKDCKWHYEITRCHYYKAYYEDYDDPSEAKPSDNFYCADGVKRDRI